MPKFRRYEVHDNNRGRWALASEELPLGRGCYGNGVRSMFERINCWGPPRSPVFCQTKKQNPNYLLKFISLMVYKFFTIYGSQFCMSW